MKNVKIEYEISSKNDKTTLVGSYEFETNNIDESFLENALKKSIDRLRKDRTLFISGIFNVFIDKVNKYKVVFLGDPSKPIKPKIYTL